MHPPPALLPLHIHPLPRSTSLVSKEAHPPGAPGPDQPGQVLKDNDAWVPWQHRVCPPWVSASGQGDLTTTARRPCYQQGPVRLNV